MRFVVGALLAGLMIAACAPAPIGDYPESDAIELPNRRSADDDDAGGGGGEEEPGGPRDSSTVTLTVTLSGAGTGGVTSTPGGVTCQGKTCTGTFAAGTTVTLVPAPGAGSMFVGWTGGCTGSGSCAPLMNGNVAVTAELDSIAGTWAGTYTNTRQKFGCTFQNKGELSISIAADGTAFSNTGTINGLELRDTSTPECRLVRTTTGSSPKETVTLDGANATGTWTFSVQGASGSLDFPYKGAFAGKKLTGSWTCATCVGSFTLTKQ